MKYRLHILLTLIFFALVGNTTISAQFDDLYYDPDKDFQFSQEEEYLVYEDDDYYDENEDGYDSYYDDYDYATRINRFRRPGRALGYYSSCYLLNGWNTFGFDPYYDPFYNSYYNDRYYNSGTSLYISFGFGNNYGWNRWNRWNRWNSWNSYRPWYASWYPSYYNSWGSSYGYGNGIYANNYYNYGNNYYGNSNLGYYNNYDRVSNPNGKYYGSRNARSTVVSTQGRLKSPRGNTDYNTTRVTDTNTKAVTTNKKAYRKGDISSNTTRTNRIFDRKKSNVDQRRDQNTYRGTTSSRSKSSRTINRGTTRSNVYKGTSRTNVNRGTSSRTFNRNKTSTRTRTTSPRTNTSRNTRSFNTTRSSNRGSSSVGRSSGTSSKISSGSRSSSSRSSSSRKKNNE